MKAKLIVLVSLLVIVSAIAVWVGWGGLANLQSQIGNNIGNSNFSLKPKEARAQSYTVKTEHPRIWLTPELLQSLKDRVAIQRPAWIGTEPDAHDIEALALSYLLTGTTSYRDRAIALVMQKINIADGYKFWRLEQVSIGFDWLYDCLSQSQKDQIIAWVNTTLENSDDLNFEAFTWSNRNYSRLLPIGLAGLVTAGDNPKAQQWIDYARITKFENLAKTGLLGITGEGGGWPEGTSYGAQSVYSLVKYVEAVRTATGEDLYSTSPWFYDRISFSLLADHPTAISYGNSFHAFRDYPALGDSDRNRYSHAAYERITRLILINRYKDTDIAKQLQLWINQPEVDTISEYTLLVEDFIWNNPDQSTQTPALLSYYAKGTGTVFMREGYSADAAHITYQAGDHFTWHQHLDQGSFTIFKKGDLAIESGVYSGEGTYAHDLQYFARTIAHNTMLIYDPQERFGNFRSGNEAVNDGGQRMFSPAGIEAITGEWWTQYKTQYDTADITKFVDNSNYTYVFSDITNAYSNPNWTHPSNNGRAKISNFTRQFVYLRPDFVVVFDRVSSMDPSFQKKWLLHTLNEPVINGSDTHISAGEDLYDGDLAVATAGNGKLFCKTLYPLNNKIRKVGGRGVKDYWVFGTNYPSPGGYEGTDYGEWRIEVEPSIPAQDDIFLNVLYPADKNVSVMPTTNRIESSTNNMVGAQINAGVNDVQVIMFSKTETKTTDGLNENIIYNISGTRNSKHLIVDLKPNTQFTIINTNLDTGAVIQTQTLNSSAQGTLYFTTPLGSNHQITLTPAGAQPPQPTPNITLTKTADKAQASSGDEITYTIAYNNTGNGAATNVVITDIIPTGTTYVAGSASNGGVLSGATLTWSIGAVSSGGSGSVSLKVKVD